MVEHFIITGSSYSEKTRLALHRAYTGGIDQNDIMTIVNELSEYDDLIYSTHYVVTDSANWDSVVSYDAFFKGIKVINSVDQMIKLMKKDSKLSGLDIAKYLISKYDIRDHLQLEKLTYLCYADYLCKFKKKLFDDKIYAFGLGPVVASVYETFKGESTICEDYSVDSLYSRILALGDGNEKLESTISSIERYGDLDSSQLITLTHSEGSPWEKNYRPNSYHLTISDSDIYKYHCMEQI